MTDTPWRLSSHVCAACFGRILARPGTDGRTRYRCSNCGAEREGHRPEALCACGITLRTGRNAGLRCVPNLQRTPECPAEIVVEELGGPQSAGAAPPLDRRAQPRHNDQK